MASLMPPPPPPPPQPPLYDLEMRIDVSSFTDSPPLSLQSLGKNLEALKNQKRKASALENLELGKTLMGLAFPAATGLVGLISQGTTNQHLLLLQLLTTGFAISFGVSFMAVLLRQSYPRIANAGEILGAVSALITFFTLVCCYVPTNQVWVLGICCVLCLICPFILLVLKSSDQCEQLRSAAG